MIPVSSLASDPTIAAQMPSLMEPGVTLVVGRDKRLVLYPCRDSTLINAVAIHPDTLSQWPPRGWNTNSRTATDVKRAYAEFAPVFHRLFELAEDIKLWQLEDSDGIDTWIRGRGCLLGDACHPMLPRTLVLPPPAALPIRANARQTWPRAPAKRSRTAPRLA